MFSDDNPYGKAKGNQKQFTTGFNLKTLFKKGFVRTTIANSTQFSNYEYRDLRNDRLKFNYDSYESDFNIKSEISYQFNSSNNFIFGATARLIKFKNMTFYNADTSAFGYILPETNVNVR